MSPLPLSSSSSSSLIRNPVPSTSKRHNAQTHQKRQSETGQKRSAAIKKTKPNTMDQELPVSYYQDEIISTLDEARVLLITAATGSGKTTLVPSYLAEKLVANQRIICALPRRIPTVAVATYVSSLRGEQVGQSVGFSIHGSKAIQNDTKIIYKTQGQLSQDLFYNFQTSSSTISTRYPVVVVDEIHERSCDCDLLLDRLATLIKNDEKFKVLLMSATTSPEQFKLLFPKLQVVDIPGRSFPIKIFHAIDVEHYMTLIIKTIIQVHAKKGLDPGAILVILPGTDELAEAARAVKWIVKELREDEELRHKILDVKCLVVHSKADKNVINEAVDPKKKDNSTRRIILATNVVESSVTIPDITTVIDSGFARRKVFIPNLRTDTLPVLPISKASAKQRSGRAGRVAPGECYRVYTQSIYHNELREFTHPESMMSNPDKMVLMLKQRNYSDISSLPFFAPHSTLILTDSIHHLICLGALQPEPPHEITDDGVKLVNMPCSVSLGAAILASIRLECSAQVIAIAAMLSSMQTINDFLTHERYLQNVTLGFGDHYALLDIFIRWNNSRTHSINPGIFNSKKLKQASDMGKQIWDSLKVKNGEQWPPRELPDDSDTIAQAFLEGFYHQVAVQEQFRSDWLTIDLKTVEYSKSNTWFDYNQFDYGPGDDAKCVIYHTLDVHVSTRMEVTTPIATSHVKNLMTRFNDPRNAVTEATAKQIFYQLYYDQGSPIAIYNGKTEAKINADIILSVWAHCDKDDEILPMASKFSEVQLRRGDPIARGLQLSDYRMMSVTKSGSVYESQLRSHIVQPIRQAILNPSPSNYPLISFERLDDEHEKTTAPKSILCHQFYQENKCNTGKRCTRRHSYAHITPTYNPSFDEFQMDTSSMKYDDDPRQPRSHLEIIERTTAEEGNADAPGRKIRFIRGTQSSASDFIIGDEVTTYRELDLCTIFTTKPLTAEKALERVQAIETRSTEYPRMKQMSSRVAKKITKLKALGVNTEKFEKRHNDIKEMDDEEDLSKYATRLKHLGILNLEMAEILMKNNNEKKKVQPQQEKKVDDDDNGDGRRGDAPPLVISLRP